MALLEARGISFSYGKGEPVLSGVDFAVASGERVALSAPSGCGKSTLCQVLAGYLEPSAGEVLVDGAPPVATLGRPNPVQLIWQHPEQAVDPYLRLGDTLAEAGDVPEDLMRGLGIQQRWLSRYPHEVSGGELQRCCVARALASHPRFVIADEMSTMLDAITQAQIWDFLLGYCEREGSGLVLVTHSEALSRRIATRTFAL